MGLLNLLVLITRLPHHPHLSPFTPTSSDHKDEDLSPSVTLALAQSCLYSPLRRLSLSFLIVSAAADRPKPRTLKPDMLLYASNPSTQEVEAGGSEVQGHLQGHSKLDINRGLCETLVWKQNKPTEELLQGT